MGAAAALPFAALRLTGSVRGLHEGMDRAPAGLYRVVVLEPGLSRRTIHDFASLDRARRYADDCASETEEGPVYSAIYNDQGSEVYRGRHYGLGPS